jgi:hypothetical protein
MKYYNLDQFILLPCFLISIAFSICFFVKSLARGVGVLFDIFFFGRHTVGVV